MSTIALHLTLNIAETVRNKGNGLRRIKWSCNRWRHV